MILQSGRDLPLTVARQDDRGRLMRCDINPIVDYLLENNIDVLAVDPYANCSMVAKVRKAVRTR